MGVEVKLVANYNDGGGSTANGHCRKNEGLVHLGEGSPFLIGAVVHKKARGVVATERGVKLVAVRTATALTLAGGLARVWAQKASVSHQSSATLLGHAAAFSACGFLGCFGNCTLTCTDPPFRVAPRSHSICASLLHSLAALAQRSMET